MYGQIRIVRHLGDLKSKTTVYIFIAEFRSHEIKQELTTLVKENCY